MPAMMTRLYIGEDKAPIVKCHICGVKRPVKLRYNLCDVCVKETGIKTVDICAVCFCLLGGIACQVFEIEKEKDYEEKGQGYHG